jgi:hypothetical protein
MVKESINFTVHGKLAVGSSLTIPKGTTLSDHTETILEGPTADLGSREWPTETVPDGPTADSGSREWPTETVPDGPTADSGSREWTQRFLNFVFLSVCAIAEIAWLTVLAWVTLSFARWLFS